MAPCGQHGFVQPTSYLGRHAYEFGVLEMRKGDPYWVVQILLTTGKGSIDIVLLKPGHAYDPHYHVGADLSANVIEGRGLVFDGRRWRKYNATPKEPVSLVAPMLVSHGFQPDPDAATVIIMEYTCSLELPNGSLDYHRGKIAL